MSSPREREEQLSKAIATGLQKLEARDHEMERRIDKIDSRVAALFWALGIIFSTALGWLTIQLLSSGVKVLSK